MKTDVVIKQQLLVTGLRPYHTKLTNDFLKACDLGIEGGFIPLLETVTLTLSKKEKLVYLPEKVKRAYEQSGCTRVVVIEI